jgi:glyoxylase-like metal-dependent hydrolase (beta-lactamase superfamily II)
VHRHPGLPSDQRVMASKSRSPSEFTPIQGRRGIAIGPIGSRHAPPPDRTADGRAAAGPEEIAPGVHWLALRGANVYFVRSASSWSLVDTARSRDGRAIRKAAAQLFAAEMHPHAILLTHGHPDHAGSAAELARAWGVPVYLHPDELPALVSEDLHCPPELLDPIGRFILPLMRLLPPGMRHRILSNGGLDKVIRPFDRGSGVPGLPEWERISTPGHSPAHLAFFRRSDRVLISGDACLTLNIFSPRDLLSGRQRLSLPPYISCWDWRRTKQSVGVLARLAPRILASGHGVPMAGEDVADDLRRFAARIAP